MKVLYVTFLVLGDAGAIAASAYVQAAVKHDHVDDVFVFDQPKNKHLIQRYGAKFLSARASSRRLSTFT